MTDNQHSSKPQALSRGEMLKVISAMGMAITASSLAPEKWVKPVVEAGVLPAHAQTSVCNPPFRFMECSDVAAHWLTEPVLTLRIECLAIISTACMGLPLRFSFILKDNNNFTVYSSGQQVYLTRQFGDADAMVFIPPSEIDGIPSAGFAHWEFANLHDGQTTCDWQFSIPPLP
jgi:hypothetical protein